MTIIIYSSVIVCIASCGLNESKLKYCKCVSFLKKYTLQVKDAFRKTFKLESSTGTGSSAMMKMVGIKVYLSMIISF